MFFDYFFVFFACFWRRFLSFFCFIFGAFCVPFWRYFAVRKVGLWRADAPKGLLWQAWNAFKSVGLVVPHFSSNFVRRGVVAGARARRNFSNKKVCWFFWWFFCCVFSFLRFSTNEQKKRAIQKNGDKNRRQKMLKKNTKNEEKTVGAKQKSIASSKDKFHSFAAVCEGYVPKRHVKHARKLEENGLKSACKKTAKKRRKNCFCCYVGWVF